MRASLMVALLVVGLVLIVTAGQKSLGWLALLAKQPALAAWFKNS